MGAGHSRFSLDVRSLHGGGGLVGARGGGSKDLQQKQQLQSALRGGGLPAGCQALGSRADLVSLSTEPAVGTSVQVVVMLGDQRLPAAGVDCLGLFKGTLATICASQLLFVKTPVGILP